VIVVNGGRVKRILSGDKGLLPGLELTRANFVLILWELLEKIIAKNYPTFRVEELCPCSDVEATYD
jgi:hypothetical protein